MSKVGIFFATGYEEIEALTVVDMLRRAGVEAKMVSVTGEKTVTSSHGVTVVMDSVIEEEDLDTFDMLVLPGGMPGTTNLQNCPKLMDAVVSFANAGKDVAAICAAPSVFGALGILKGKKACCYPSFEEKLEGAEVNMNSVNVDGNIITSRGMGTAIDFALAIVEKLMGAEKAESLAKAIIYQK